MSILNVDKIQPIGGGSTITVDATDIQASTGTITASTFSGDVSATGIGVTSLNITGVTTSAGIVQAAQFKLLDNAKAVYGSSADMEIYHNATNSLIQNGTGSLQIVTTTGDLFLRGQDNITFNTAGNNERLRITSAGRVGINETSPDGELHIKGTNPFIYLEGTNGSGRQHEIWSAGGNSQALQFTSGELYYNADSHYFRKSDETTEHLRITSTGAWAIEGASNYGTSGQVLTSNGNDAPTWQDSGGVSEVDTTVSTTNPTGVGSFAAASYRSAMVRLQINQLNTDYQVGRYMLIHDGTTVTVLEEAAVSTGSTMVGSITGVIDGSNVELRVTLASAGVSTVTTIFDKITV